MLSYTEALKRIGSFRKRAASPVNREILLGESGNTNPYDGLVS